MGDLEIFQSTEGTQGECAGNLQYDNRVQTEEIIGIDVHGDLGTFVKVDDQTGCIGKVIMHPSIRDVAPTFTHMIISVSSVYYITSGRASSIMGW